MEKTFRSFFYILLALTLCFVPVSCSEEDDEDDTSYMTGTVEFDHPTYVLVGQVVTFEAKGITTPSDPEYKWRVADIYSDTLKVNPVTIQFPDTLGSYTVTAYAYADGYYGSSTAVTINTVDTTLATSLTGIHRGKNVFVDQRDGKSYRYEQIGSLEWFTQNLAYDRKGAAYENSPATHSFFGRFYYWNEATLGQSGSGILGGPQGICPKGWRIPTNEDWADLARAMAGREISFYDKWEGLGSKASAEAYFNEERLWNYSPDNLHTNDFGWNALPLGNTQYDMETFSGFNEYAFFWSATEKNDNQAYLRYIYYDLGDFPANYTSKKGFGANVRCVRLPLTTVSGPVYW